MRAYPSGLAASGAGEKCVSAHLNGGSLDTLTIYNGSCTVDSLGMADRMTQTGNA